ncbi:MAG: nucleotidyltransferase domain-containing protein [Pseudomonadota bacterium]
MLLTFLFPEYRRRVLVLLLLHPESQYHVREIARITNTAAGSLHRELSKLAEAQVLIREKSGNQVYYQANPTFPIFEELASILRKTSGLVDVLANALAPLAEKIEVAFVFGSAGSGKENLGSDIDVLIIGEISYTDAVSALYPAQTTVRREINPKVYSKAEWQKLVRNKNAFIKDILKKPKLFIIGTASDIE